MPKERVIITPALSNFLRAFEITLLVILDLSLIHISVTLNLRLIEAPEECIEYVALHEVCHIIYPDHGKNFHALMDKLLPHNKSIRKKLKESVILN